MFLVEISHVMCIKCPPIPQGAVKTDSEHPGARPDPHRNEKDRSRARGAIFGCYNDILHQKEFSNPDSTFHR